MHDVENMTTPTTSNFRSGVDFLFRHSIPTSGGPRIDLTKFRSLRRIGKGPSRHIDSIDYFSGSSSRSIKRGIDSHNSRPRRLPWRKFGDHLLGETSLPKGCLSLEAAGFKHFPAVGISAEGSKVKQFDDSLRVSFHAFDFYRRRAGCGASPSSLPAHLFPER